MMPNSPAERTLALHLLAAANAATAATSDTPDRIAVTRIVFQRLADVLTRWFGPFGYHALLSRALAHASADHPALKGVTIRSAAEPSLAGLAEGIEQHGADAATEGVVAVLTALIALLGRLIGQDTAHKLIDQSALLPGPGADLTKDGES